MPSQISPPGVVSLVFAVTGHRDLCPEEFEVLELEVGKIFADFQKKDRFPHTPLILLSALAEGADRIAVRAATAASIPYIAVLPMPQDLYRKDFETEASDIEFEELLTGAESRIVLPLVENHTVEEVAQPGPARDLQYQSLAAFLVNHSHILVAIWDKKKGIGKGGTSEVVAMKLGDIRSSVGNATFGVKEGGAGPVYKIQASRLSAPETLPGLRCTREFPGESTADNYDAIYKRLDHYNADVEKFSVVLEEAARRSKERLFEGGAPTGLTPAMEWVASVFAWADTLAIHFASRSLRLWKRVFALLVFGGVALAWLHSPYGKWTALSVYYAFLLSAFFLGRWEVKRRGRNRHEDYRAFAEALRVQFFWMVAGLPDLAANVQAGDMVWIRNAISECRLHKGVLECHEGIVEGCGSQLSLLRKWVEGQVEYFRKRSLACDQKEKIFHIAAISLASVGLVFPLFGLFVTSLGIKHKAGLATAWHAISGIAMWWAALSWNYSERRGFAQEATQYARMYDLFAAAGADLRKLEKQGLGENSRSADEIIRNLAREALAESGDWLWMHRERKLTPGLGV
jgi:hypothetical protein